MLGSIRANTTKPSKIIKRAILSPSIYIEVPTLIGYAVERDANYFEFVFDFKEYYGYVLVVKRSAKLGRVRKCYITKERKIETLLMSGFDLSEINFEKPKTIYNDLVMIVRNTGIKIIEKDLKIKVFIKKFS